MDDLIRRSDTIEAIEVVDWYHQNRNKDMVSGANSDEHQAWYKADDIYKALEEVPSADRPQGEWVDRSDGSRILHPWWESYECSQCKEQGSGAWNFCPNCGARMKGADDETD